MAGLDERFPVYSKLLRLYPTAYRQRYGRQMLQTLADMLDHAGATPQKFSIWSRVALDLPLSAATQQVLYTGGIMAHETPDYVKRSALIGGALLAPFFIIIASNVLSRYNLPNSGLWNRFFFCLIFVLPAMAFLLNLATFVKWAAERKAPFWESLFGFHRNWPMLLTAGLALAITLFVPLHDSVHCVTGNPLREARNWHDTWQCVRNG